MTWLFLTGCGATIVAGDGSSGAGGGANSAGGGSGAVLLADGGLGLSGDAGLSCEVASVLATHCISCHGASPSGGAPYALTTRTQLLEVAPGFSPATKADRSLERMTAGTMPPFPAPAPSSAELAAFRAWVQGGAPAGSCDSVSTTPADAGQVVITPTCASGTYWTRGDAESKNMEPGWACRSCHATNEKNYFFMGTVFPGVHEQLDCDAKPPVGVKVEILDSTGAVQLTLTPLSPSGNFYNDSSRPYGDNGKFISLPYRARIVGPTGKTAEMMTGQTDGDCNNCHTMAGAHDAPGRIVWPL